MRVNKLGKVAGAAVAADVLLNGGKGTKAAASTGCGCYVIAMGLIAAPFIWILRDCM